MVLPSGSETSVSWLSRSPSLGAISLVLHTDMKLLRRSAASSASGARAAATISSYVA
ncbi:MAG: hypothetical protein WCG86_08255 [Actinomycetota bacterium]